MGCDKHYDPNVMQVDHDFPRAKCGQDNIENLQVLCSGCNSRKGTMTITHDLSYITSLTWIPSRFKPSRNTAPACSSKRSRESRSLSSALRMGQFS